MPIKEADSKTILKTILENDYLIVIYNDETYSCIIPRYDDGDTFLDNSQSDEKFILVCSSINKGILDTTEFINVLIENGIVDEEGLRLQVINRDIETRENRLKKDLVSYERLKRMYGESLEELKN